MRAIHGILYIVMVALGTFEFGTAKDAEHARLLRSRRGAGTSFAPEQNLSTGDGFERLEQKGVLGPDRDLYLKGKICQHSGTETPREHKEMIFFDWPVLTKVFNDIAYVIQPHAFEYLHMADWRSDKSVANGKTASNLHAHPVCGLEN